MAGITITTQNDLPGPDGDEPYVRFRQEVKRHPEPGEDGPELELEGYPVEQGAAQGFG